MSQNPVIVIIEDEEDMLELLEYRLTKENFDVVGFTSTHNVKKFLDEEDVDLLMVDRNLPEVEGSDFVESLRKVGYTIPVIFMTAKVSQDDKIDGFLKGGDDYVTKPFNTQEFILRIKALINRTKPEQQDIVNFRDIVLKPKSKEVFVNTNSIQLTKLEFDLLFEFIKNKNVVLTREYLLENVWQDYGDFQEKTVNVAINRLKDKIDPDKNKNYIRSVRGSGYTIC